MKTILTMTHFRKKENPLFGLLFLLLCLSTKSAFASTGTEAVAGTLGTTVPVVTNGSEAAAPSATPPAAAIGPAPVTIVPNGTPPKIPTLVLVDPTEKTSFEGKVLPALRPAMANCKQCTVINVTPYDGSGNFKSKELLDALSTVPTGQSVLVFLFNRKYFPKDDEALVKKVKDLVQSGVVVVATAGRPKVNEPTLALNRTLWGQIPEVILIGELEGAERLVAGTFYGPELLTAVRPSENFPGIDRGALPFAIRLLANFKNKSPTQWPTYLREKKSKIRQFWPRPEDLILR